MINNKKLFLLAVSLIPLVVISFILKDKTNFILSEKDSPIIYIKTLYDGEVLELELEKYITGVVAGEMPALFNEEALKAQAVASRTYALYRKQNNNGVYDLTSNTTNQVYLDEKALIDKWGSNYKKYMTKIMNAVNETKGEVLTYDNKLIDALYFSMSSGKTQDVKNVFKENLDYLKSTDSIYDNDNLNGFKVLKKISIQEFISSLKLNCSYPIVENIAYNENGYVREISICGEKFEGNEFRKKLYLRSANFKIEITDEVEITTYGYGHGVGMSQYGANGYANAGYSYIDILKHYYTGVEIKDIKNV